MDALYRRLMPVVQEDLPATLLAPNVSATVAHRRVHGLSSPYGSSRFERIDERSLDEE